MKKNIIFISIAVVIIAILFLLSENIKPRTVRVEENLLDIDYNIKGNEASLKYDTYNPLVAMYIENYGSIVIELFPDYAPNTVNNFIYLVKSGFYDNNTFHRLDKDSVHVLQGGDPKGIGSGGPGYHIKGEFTENGFENKLSHTKGIVSMARSQAPDSAGSQFFICIDDVKELDGKYATFGRVIAGWDNIEKIVEKERVADQTSGKLVRNLVIKKALVDLKGKEYPEPEKVGE